MMKSPHHPKDSDLQAYSGGSLESGVALIISTHLESCSTCTEKVRVLTQQMTNNFFSFEENSFEEIDLEAEFKDLQKNLNQEGQQNIHSLSEYRHTKQSPQISFGDKTFSLPEALSSVSERPLTWRSFGESSGVSKVTHEDHGNLLFIYVGPGEVIPEHGHAGREYGCVIEGKFESHGQSFSTGDFTFYDQNTHHSPKALSEGGCLVLVWLEKRLNFLSGPLKPFNPLLWWYLNRI